MRGWVRCPRRSWSRRLRRSIDVDTLVEFLGERLAKFKVPRTVWVVDRLPLNAAGKVAKAELRSDAAVRLAS